MLYCTIDSYTLKAVDGAVSPAYLINEMKEFYTPKLKPVMLAY